MLAANLRTVKWVVLSLFCTSALGGTVLRLYEHFLLKKSEDTSCIIDTIIQTGPCKEALSTLYLTELLDLSSDHPSNYYSFSLEEAKSRLLEGPIFKEVFLEKRSPSTLYIDYTIRKPIALVADYVNMAIDEEGYLFPLEPFFSPKKLPEIVLGLTEYLPKIESKEIVLAMEVLYLLQDNTRAHEVEIKRIDTSNAYADSFGKREIIVVLGRGGKTHFLRLSTRQYVAGLSHYLEMKGEQLQDEVIDLRIPNIAYVMEVM